MRSGTILEGEELVIPYANSLIVNGHRWLANEDSPYRVNVYGPGEKIIYITYSDEGSVGDVDDPEASERERFEMYLERAKKRMRQSLAKKQRRFWTTRLFVKATPNVLIVCEACLHR